MCVCVRSIIIYYDDFRAWMQLLCLLYRFASIHTGPSLLLRSPVVLPGCHKVLAALQDCQTQAGGVKK